jgi:hypothetical protein
MNDSNIVLNNVEEIGVNNFKKITIVQDDEEDEEDEEEDEEVEVEVEEVENEQEQ